MKSRTTFVSSIIAAFFASMMLFSSSAFAEHCDHKSSQGADDFLPTYND